MGVAVVFFEELLVGSLVEVGGENEGLEVFFEDQGVGDGVGFYFLVVKLVAKKRNEKFVL